METVYKPPPYDNFNGTEMTNRICKEIVCMYQYNDRYRQHKVFPLNENAFHKESAP